MITLVEVGKIIVFILIIIILGILVWQLYSELPHVNMGLVGYSVLLIGGLIIIVMPEIEEFNVLGSGFKKAKKSDQNTPHYLLVEEPQDIDEKALEAGELKIKKDN